MFASTKLDEQQIEKLKAILKAGAIAYGFPNEQWTGKRIRRVVLETFQIEYNANDCLSHKKLGTLYSCVLSPTYDLRTKIDLSLILPPNFFETSNIVLGIKNELARLFRLPCRNR